MAQHLASLAHETSFQVLIDVRKAYALLDRGVCVEILKGYELGPNMARLLGYYWEKQKILPKEGKFLGWLFGTGQGVTQGDLASTMLFNIVVDTVVQAVMTEVCGPKEAHHRMGRTEGERNLVFYADNSRIAGRYSDWVQEELAIPVDMFIRVGLETNLDKTKEVVFTPRFILIQIRDVT